MNHNKVLNNILEEWNNLVYSIDTDAAHSIDLTNSYHFVLLERAMNNLDLPSWFDKKSLMKEIRVDEKFFTDLVEQVKPHSDSELIRSLGATSKISDEKVNDIRTDYYINNKKFDKKFFNALKQNNSKFERTLQIDSRFNRFVAYDAHQWHSADGFFNKDIKGGRLTLVSFINNIGQPNSQLKFPLPEMKRTI